MSKTIQKRQCYKMPNAAKKVALTAIADRFVDEARKERKRADEDGDDADFYDAFVEACCVDSGLLSGNSKTRFAETFGEGKTEFEFGEISASASVERGADGTMRGVAIYENGSKTFIDAADLADSKAKPSTKMVCVKIDTGKGGKASFWVPSDCAM
tara:strand:- start:273 stop:740 length:468 start_codon:yes stop_codon:yes gene_type:complete